MDRNVFEMTEKSKSFRSEYLNRLANEHCCSDNCETNDRNVAAKNDRNVSAKKNRCSL